MFESSRPVWNSFRQALREDTEVIQPQSYKVYDDNNSDDNNNSSPVQSSFTTLQRSLASLFYV